MSELLVIVTHALGTASVRWHKGFDVAQFFGMAPDEGQTLIVGPQGRLVIPAAIRRELGLAPGAILAARVEDGRLVLEPREVVLTRLRRRFQKVTAGVSLADELIDERRKEARRESRR
jgi:AbrB family looped-hinge helix DNA binding protein